MKRKEETKKKSIARKKSLTIFFGEEFCQQQLTFSAKTKKKKSVALVGRV
jgi:hypothetical protein